MKWFGENWGAPVCKISQQAPTPVGCKCLGCEVEIKEGEKGLTLPHVGENVVSEVHYHLPCFLKSVLG